MIPPRLPALLAAGLLLAVPFRTLADDSQWDWLAGTQWYVPAANLLAYFASPTNLSDNIPVADQTLWDITSSTNGTFTGTAQATFTVLGSPIVSTSTFQGLATPQGQVRMVFSPTGGGGSQTVGIGQVRDLGLPTQQIEMQMVTMAGSAYVTHWAYMAEVPSGSFTPPTEIPPGTLLSQEWNWTQGTSWTLAAPGVFGVSEPGTFFIDSYVNGYFWGTGIGPSGVGSPTFSHLGSITPEGNVLFNLLLDGSLVNLTGAIQGDITDGSMFLRGYMGTEDFGEASVAQVIPEPSVGALLAGAGLTLWALRRARKT